MSNDLMNLSNNSVAKFDESVFEKAVSSGKYLPRLQLMTSSSEKCKSGEFPINSYAMIAGQTYHDMGKEVDILVLAWRPKAVDMSGDVIITVFDANSDQFNRIMEKADIKDSKCMFGPEYLVYIAKNKKFATFFMGSKSARKEAPVLQGLLARAATLKSKKIETKQYTWFAPAISPCNTPFELPTQEAAEEEAAKFLNPPASEVEEAPSEESGRAR